MKFLSSLGSLMAIFGIISTILYFIGYNLKLLMWIDLWGPTAGWVIRGALIVVGAVLFIAFKGAGKEK